MKVLFIVENDFPPNIRVENEIGILKAFNHSFDVITFTHDKNAAGKTEHADVNVFKYYIPKLIYKSKVAQFKYPQYNNFWKKCLNDHLSKNESNYDAVHAVDLSTLPQALWVKQKFKLPVILDLFENYPYLIKNADHTQSRMGKFLADFDKILSFEKQNVKLADVVITTAPQMTERLLQNDNRPERYFLYRNVIDTSKYVTPQKVEESIDILYAGGITSARGIQQVITASAEIVKTHPNLNFTIVGDGRYVEDLKQLTLSLNLEKNVHFTGRKTQQEVFDYINKAKICVIPHLRSKQNDNTTSNKIFQYSFHQKPVLSTDAPATVTLINEMKCGLIYEEGNINQLVDKIIQLLEDEELRKQFGSNGKQAVLHKFNTKIEGVTLQKAYQFIEENYSKH